MKKENDNFAKKQIKQTVDLLKERKNRHVFIFMISLIVMTTFIYIKSDSFFISFLISMIFSGAILKALKDDALCDDVEKISKKSKDEKNV